MVLTSSDIGTNPAQVEINLTRHFKTARAWGAVLLIDEADVFMERRSTADLVRNSLVAGKLYYKETNRNARRSPSSQGFSAHSNFMTEFCSLRRIESVHLMTRLSPAYTYSCTTGISMTTRDDRSGRLSLIN